MRSAIAIVVLAACANKVVPRDEPAPRVTVDARAAVPDDASTPTDATAAAAPRFDADPACTESLDRLRRALRDLRFAKDIRLREAREAWLATPASCRGGTWHLFAQQLLPRRRPPNATPLAAGDGISFDTQADAFIAGLRAEPDHPLLLAHLALLHAIDPDAYPALPSGACQALTDRLEREPTQSPGVSQRELDEHRAYVCAHAALAAGDHEAAARHFAASSSRYPDRRLRQIEALVALGRKREARALAAEARRDIEPVAVDRGFGAGDEQAVWKKQLAAALRR